MKRNETKELPLFIVIVGLPASGKSTLAVKLSEKLGVPVLEKDELKESLFDTVGFRCYAEKRQLDVAANEVLLRAAGKILDAGQSLIAVNNFRKDMEGQVGAFLRDHPAKTAFIFLEGDADVFFRRYVERDNNRARHIGHALQDHYPLLPGETPEIVPFTRERFREVFETLGMGDFRVDCKQLHVKVEDGKDLDADAVIAELMKTLEN